MLALISKNSVYLSPEGDDEWGPDSVWSLTDHPVENEVVSHILNNIAKSSEAILIIGLSPFMPDAWQALDVFINGRGFDDVFLFISGDPIVLECGDSL